MNMLLADKTTPQSLPQPKRQSWDEDQYPVLDSSDVNELETNRARGAELDAKAPGPQILEIGLKDVREELETDCERGAELDAKAPGPQILEIGSKDARKELGTNSARGVELDAKAPGPQILELEPKSPRAELEG